MKENPFFYLQSETSVPLFNNFDPNNLKTITKHVFCKKNIQKKVFHNIGSFTNVLKPLKSVCLSNVFVIVHCLSYFFVSDSRLCIEVYIVSFLTKNHRDYDKRCL